MQSALDKYNFKERSRAFLKMLLIVFTLIIPSIKAFSHVDSLKVKQLAFGFNITKEINFTNVYSPRNYTLVGTSIGVKNLIFRISANYINRGVFENQNYTIGSRDKRLIPLSGYELSLFYVKQLYNSKIIHPVFGITYRKSIIYGGWNNLFYISSFNYSIERVVNFNDKFHQICGVFGMYFSNKNKFGYSITFPVGIVIQNISNSHFDVQNYVSHGTGYHNEVEKKSARIGMCFGLNINLFYNLKTN